MGSSKSRARRKQPSEKQSPFFDKQSGDAAKFFSGRPVQRKVNIGKANSAAEKEAESAARQVTQVQKAEKKEEEPVQKAEKKEEEKPVQKAEKKEEEKPVQKADNKEEEKPVQKAEKKEEEKPVQKADKKEEEKPVQKAAKKEDDSTVQTKKDAVVQRAGQGSDSDRDAAPSFEERLMARKGMGNALPDDVRKDMETKFRTSFKEVKVHTDKEAADMCESIHAMAFAHDHDIYFNTGMYSPDTETGRELLAHELAHVVQQNG